MCVDEFKIRMRENNSCAAKLSNSISKCWSGHSRLPVQTCARVYLLILCVGGSGGFKDVNNNSGGFIMEDNDGAPSAPPPCATETDNKEDDDKDDDKEKYKDGKHSNDDNDKFVQP